MSSLLKGILLLCLVVLEACTSGGEDNVNAPVIESVFTDIVQFHPSFYEKFGSSYPVVPLKFTVSISVYDRQGVFDIEDVAVVHKESQKAWYLLGGPNSISWTACYDADSRLFECSLYDSDDAERQPLVGWEVVVTDSQGNTVRSDFQFKLPAGQMLGDEAHAISENITPFDNSVEAMAPLSLLRNNVVFEKNVEQETFTIEFEGFDSRAQDYGLYFYGGESGTDYVGSVCLCSASIEAEPLEEGERVSLSLAWSDIDFRDDYNVDSVQGLHIVLYDKSTAWRPNGRVNGVWFNYLSFSEYFLLTD